jgi:hypothetical protein
MVFEVKPVRRKRDASQVHVLLLAKTHLREPVEQVGYRGELTVHKMTATQKLLKPPAPVAERERRIWLLQDGFNREAYMQDIGVDHR